MKLTKGQLKVLIESILNEEEMEKDSDNPGELYLEKVLEGYEEAYEKDGITGLVLRMITEGVINVSNMARMYKDLDKYKEIYTTKGFEALVKHMHEDGIDFRDEALKQLVEKE